MRIYAFKELTSTNLAEIATIVHEPRQSAVWEELARRELNEHDRVAVGLIVEKIRDYKTQRVNEATIWARAIYPLLALAEQGEIRAWSQVSLAATFGDVEIRGEADGALAASIDEEIGLPYLVVVEAKRGTSGSDPMAQLLGAMLCAGRLNEQDGHPHREMYGAYTIADVWTFLRGQVSYAESKPSMTVLSSREYWEKTEASTILAMLATIVFKALP